MFLDCLIRFGHSQMLALKLSNAGLGALISLRSVENPPFILLFCFNLSHVFILLPSSRVTQFRMPTWSVGTSECPAVCALSGSSPNSRLRLRLSSPVQSTSFRLCLVFCPCCLRRSCSCVFPWFCPCFLSCLFSCLRLCFLVFVWLVSVSVLSVFMSVCCRV